MSIAWGVIAAIMILFIGIGIVIIRSNVSDLEEITQVVNKIGEGDLTRKIHIKKNVALGHIFLYMNQVILRMRGFINQATIMTDKLALHCDKLKRNGEEVQRLTEGTCIKIEGISIQIEKQHSQLKQTEELVENLMNGQQDIERNGEFIQSLSHNMDTKMKETLDVYKNLVDKLNESALANKELAIKSTSLYEKAYKTQTIVDAVNQISDHTKLLAFNASIEAARAGQDGAGFAVIAQEIQRLANTVSSQSKEIQGILDEIKEGITEIANGMNKEVEVITEHIRFSDISREYLEQTRDANKETLQAVKNINGIIAHQSETIEGIKEIVGEVNEIGDKIDESAAIMNIEAQEQFATVIELFDQVSTLVDLNKDVKDHIDEFIKNYEIDRQTQNYIQEGLQTIVALSKNEILETMDYKNCTEFLKNKIAQYPYFELFGLVDRKGTRKAITLDYTEAQVYRSFAHRTYFQEAVGGKAFQSKPYISGDTNNYCIAIAVPVKNSGNEIVGILMGDLILG